MARARIKAQRITALAAAFALVLAACGSGGSGNAKAKTQKGTPTPACPPGTGPYKVTAYVANGGSGDVTPIDDATHTAGTPIKVGPATVPPSNVNSRIAGPFDIAAMPDGSAVWVAVRNTNKAVRIDTGTNTVTATVTVGADPRGITVSPDGKYVLTANFSGSVTRIDLNSNYATHTVKVAPSAGPYDIAVDPQSTYAWVTDGLTNDVRQIQINPLAAVGTTKINAQGVTRLAIKPDGSRAYVTSPSEAPPLPEARDVTPIQLSGGPPATADPFITLSQKSGQGNDGPWDIVISHDAKTAWVTMLNGQRVIPIDLQATPPVEKPPAQVNQPPEVNLGGGALYGIDITPNDRTLYVPRAGGLDDVRWIDLTQATPTVHSVTGYTGTSPDAVAVAAGCQGTSSSSSSTSSTTSRAVSGNNSACPTIASLPSGATSVSTKSVLFDGSHNGTLRVYQLNGVWHARGEMQGNAFDDEVITGPGPTMHAIGGYKINGDSTEEAWVNAGQGASTDILTFFVYEQCKLWQIKLNGSPALFPIGASLTHAQGLGCFGFNTGIEVFDTTSNDGDHYTGTSKVYTIHLGPPPTLILGATANQSESASAGGNAFQSLSTFNCGSLTI